MACTRAEIMPGKSFSFRHLRMHAPHRWREVNALIIPKGHRKPLNVVQEQLPGRGRESLLSKLYNVIPGSHCQCWRKTRISLLTQVSAKGLQQESFFQGHLKE